RQGNHYIVNGQKIFISRVQHSDLMILLARTTPREQSKKKSQGLSVFLVDLREAVGHGLTVKPIRVIMNNETNELHFNHVAVPVENLIGVEGEGFRYILDGMNAERILIAAECIGDGRWFVERATQRAKERSVFGRPIGQNQGIQFPIAQAHIHVEAANVALQTYGGYGLAADYDIERKFRETRLYQIAPISTNLILSYVGEHVLGLPRSF